LAKWPALVVVSIAVEVAVIVVAVAVGLIQALMGRVFRLPLPLQLQLLLPHFNAFEDQVLMLLLHRLRSQLCASITKDLDSTLLLISA